MGVCMSAHLIACYKARLRVISVQNYSFVNLGLKSQYIVALYGILYAGSWGLLDSKIAILGPGIRKSSGDSVLEFISTPTNINGVHYVKVM